MPPYGHPIVFVLILLGPILYPIFNAYDFLCKFIRTRIGYRASHKNQEKE